MSDQLGLHMSRDQVYSSQHLASLQAPDGTGGVNAGRTCRTNLPVKTYAAPTKEQLSPFHMPTVQEVSYQADWDQLHSSRRR